MLLTKLNRYRLLQNKKEVLFLYGLQRIKNFSILKLFTSPYWAIQDIKSMNIANPLYDISLYKTSIENFQKYNYNIGNIYKSKNRKSVVLRHDIDTLKCVDNIPMFLKIELAYNLSASYFFRVDNIDYKAEYCIQSVKLLKENNMHIGLHSLAYNGGDIFNNLATEIDDFKRYFGFLPDSYNFHGGFDKFLVNRLYLSNNFRKVKKRFPHFLISDSMSSYYDYHITDCRFQSGKRYLRLNSHNCNKGIINIIKPKIVYLTHPCYWNPESYDSI